MIELIKGSERGRGKREGRQSRYSFSFEEFVEAKLSGFHSLRVLNEDILLPKSGYEEAFYRDVEMLTYVVKGTVEHIDNLGNRLVLREGEVQRLTAGSGISCRKHNLSQGEKVHLFQFWVQPNQHNLKPSVEQKVFSSAAKWGQWCALVTSNARDGSLLLHQDLDLYATMLEKNDELLFEALRDRFYWVQIVSGQFRVQGEIMAAGDGLSMSEQSELKVVCDRAGELLLFDVGN